MTIETLYSIYLNNPLIQTDTRKILPGGIFFALKGTSFNGNEYAKEALDAGAAFAVIDETEYLINDKTILVDNALNTLQLLARYHRKQFKIPFIAITGSNGKTTTKELVHTVLSTTFKTYTTVGNLNNHIGIPLTILKIKSDAEMAVIEMGANHLREIASYCEITEPDYGLITNCGKAHLEGFGGEEGVRKGKGELFDYLRAHKGTAFIMQDYNYLQEMSKGISSVNTYGTANASIEGKLIAANPFLKVEMIKGIEGFIQTALVGAYNLPNVLAAVAIGAYFKIPDEKIIAAIENYNPSNSRSQLIKKGTNNIIVDAYNANPSSMKAAIENFGQSPANNKYLVLGSMAELGTSSFQEHENIISEINRHKWAAVLLVGELFNQTNHPYQQFANAAEAGIWLHNRNLQNAYVLIKGSRSMQMEKVLEYI